MRLVVEDPPDSDPTPQTHTVPVPSPTMPSARSWETLQNVPDSSNIGAKVIQMRPPPPMQNLALIATLHELLELAEAGRVLGFVWAASLTDHEVSTAWSETIEGGDVSANYALLGALEEAKARVMKAIQEKT